jgi:peptide/nickel transport system permease protein
VIIRIAGRLIYAGLVVLAVAGIVFGLLQLSGDPVNALAPPGSSPEDLQRLREKHGLDRPMPAQFAIFVVNAAQGDFGESWRSGRPALDLVLERLPRTLILAGLALALALTVAIPLGVLAGMRPGGKVDLGTSLVAVGGQAVPGFWLGTILILVFAVRLGWLPSSGGAGWRALILPVVTLAAYPIATLARLIRASVSETRSADFVRTAYAKGLPRSTVTRRHILRNALLPALAYTGVQAGFLLGGAVVVEGVFAYPGIGQLALQSVASRDLPVVQTVVMVSALFIVLANLLADLLATLLDPRLGDRSGARLGGAS